jgi:hypothetical protein
MRLEHLVEKVDWNTKTEKQQIAMVSKAGYYGIGKIKNPSEAVQLAAVSCDGYAIEIIIDNKINPSEAVQLAAVAQHGSAIMHIKDPSPVVIKTALTNPELIRYSITFDEAVKKLFANNSLLMKKWLRYGEAMRTQQ